jgi:transcriptional regulator GlxA family with amidase domain
MDARIEIVISLMRELKGANLSVNSLSATVNLAPSRLREIFKRDTGVSPAKYLRNLRMQRAEELLLNTFLSVKEITLVIGVRDVSHFVRDFKRRSGQTPTKFRAAKMLAFGSVRKRFKVE